MIMSNTSNLDHGTLEDTELDAVSGGAATEGGFHHTATPG
jgi:hypothetical protein